MHPLYAIYDALSKDLCIVFRCSYNVNIFSLSEHFIYGILLVSFAHWCCLLRHVLGGCLISENPVRYGVMNVVGGYLGYKRLHKED